MELKDITTVEQAKALAFDCIQTKQLKSVVSHAYCAMV